MWRDGAPAKEAQQRAAQREAAQARIPKHLLYSKGWPQVMPTQSEARLLSEVRRSMADIMQVPMHYTNADAVLAKLHLGLVVRLVERYTQPGDTIADPMAGIGSTLLAAAFQRHVIAREIEPHWLELLRDNAARIQAQAGLFAGNIDIEQADARQGWNYCTDHILFSPPYGCEASTTPNVHRSLPYRLREKQALYDPRWQSLIEHSTAGSMGALAFHYGTHEGQIGHLRGSRYWQAMEQIYTQARAALRPSGFMIVVIKDHIRQGKRVCTADETSELCQRLGFCLYDRQQRHASPLSLWQRRRKEAGLPVVEEEDVLVFTQDGGTQ